MSLTKGCGCTATESRHDALQERERKRQEEADRAATAAAEEERRRKDEEAFAAQAAAQAAEREASLERRRKEKAAALGVEPDKGPDITQVHCCPQQFVVFEGYSCARGGSHADSKLTNTVLYVSAGGRKVAQRGEEGKKVSPLDCCTVVI